MCSKIVCYPTRIPLHCGLSSLQKPKWPVNNVRKLHSCSATIDFYSDWTKPVLRQGPFEWYICFAFVTKAQICNMSLVLLLLFSTDRLSRSVFGVCLYCFDVKERYRITLLHNNMRMTLYWSVYYHTTYENSPMNSWDGWKNMYAVSKNANIGIFV